MSQDLCAEDEGLRSVLADNASSNRQWPIVYKSNGTREKWVECEIVEERYKLDQGYKIELRALDEKYGKETFYIEDFL